MHRRSAPVSSLMDGMFDFLSPISSVRRWLCRTLLAFCFLPTFQCSAQQQTPSAGWKNDPPPHGRFVQVGDRFMVPYTVTLPNSEIRFDMVPVPAGTFRMGSPGDEAGRKADEGPQFSVTVEPFWMGRCEVTWAEYKHFMGLYDVLKSRSREEKEARQNSPTKTYTVPTPLYDSSFTYALGEEPAQPAVSMSQYAAKQYTQWISSFTGQFYRLPTEAEWEYACRAGTTTRFCFGDDEVALGEYAWFYRNSDDAYHEVGQKQPNGWGLHDMHGNVGEMVLDQYRAESYAKRKQIAATRYQKAGDEVFGRVVRGGAWDLDAVDLRCAARDATEDWRVEDPNFPKSPWWFTDEASLCVGFRIARPVAEPPLSERVEFYRADVDNLRVDVEARLDEGRGVQTDYDPRHADEDK